jgi:hypothetical protein
VLLQRVIPGLEKEHLHQGRAANCTPHFRTPSLPLLLLRNLALRACVTHAADSLLCDLHNPEQQWTPNKCLKDTNPSFHCEKPSQAFSLSRLCLRFTTSTTTHHHAPPRTTDHVSHPRHPQLKYNRMNLPKNSS